MSTNMRDSSRETNRPLTQDELDALVQEVDHLRAVYIGEQLAKFARFLVKSIVQLVRLPFLLLLGQPLKTTEHPL